MLKTQHAWRLKGKRLSKTERKSLGERQGIAQKGVRAVELRKTVPWERE